MRFQSWIKVWRGFFFAAGFCALLLSGCASSPAVRPITGYTPGIGEKAARTAESMVGRPYKYRGETPAGFDCSGLARYSYLKAGLDVPHGTKALRGATRAVSKRSMQRGDLLFFDEKGGPYSHVGIYTGNDCFVHAPSSGKKVRKNCLHESYWEKHFMEVRRFLE